MATCPQCGQTGIKRRRKKKADQTAPDQKQPLKCPRCGWEGTLWPPMPEPADTPDPEDLPRAPEAPNSALHLPTDMIQPRRLSLEPQQRGLAADSIRTARYGQAPPSRFPRIRKLLDAFLPSNEHGWETTIVTTLLVGCVALAVLSMKACSSLSSAE